MNLFGQTQSGFIFQEMICIASAAESAVWVCGLRLHDRAVRSQKLTGPGHHKYLRAPGSSLNFADNLGKWVLVNMVRQRSKLCSFHTFTRYI